MSNQTQTETQENHFTSLSYVPALDGIRAIAILLVIAFHFNDMVPFGWMGVQMFFVLSGYLITSILLSDTALPIRIYLAKFYYRRTLRIFPVHYLVLAGVAVAFLITHKPIIWPKEWIFMVTYTSNFARLLPMGILGPYSHFWSLAVEEQYYLIWPMVVYYLSRKSSLKLAIGAIVLLPIVKTVVGLWLLGLGRTPDYAGIFMYMFTPLQFDAFATGTAIALVGASRLRDLRLPLIGFGLFLLLGVINLGLIYKTGADLWTYRIWLSLGYIIYGPHNYGFIWMYTAINLMSAGLIILCLTPSKVGSMLAWKPLVRIGRVSYGMYIFHGLMLLPVKRLGLMAPEPWTLSAIFGMVIFTLAVWVVSEISYGLFEKRFLAMKDRYRFLATGIVRNSNPR